ncbi:peptide/nickel transport system ATP-binding protein [Butyrivibrio proteoclasticus]|uniref:Peptide/nickel transport system ATP-binding protein n=1 Tax=Butyrivibrio proteoclasticus TaxID=43305 RepID=A0A1I5R9M1_9FIRM|nr:ABC transporter ATP-binding protein [Butyrivibrio proteoclasticus]SFP55232.1 peptide/nickel transport system ATP-binding protein [Butyrivibrio proteoclasticus]
MPDSDINLEGKNLNKSYVDKGKKLQVLKDVSFFLKNGEILGIVGESGSGKSTLLRLVTCLEKPDSGNLYYKGTEYTGKSPAFAGTFLQMIFQDAQMSFDPRMKMKKAVVEAAKGCGHEKLSRILEAVGLDESLLEKKAGSMSGGQCQRMSIARALCSDAGILLCDEATSALDVTTQAQVVALLQQLRKKEGVSIIFVSHDIALVSMLCDRIMVMKNGECVEEGETGKVLGNPQHWYTRELLDNLIE